MSTQVKVIIITNIIVGIIALVALYRTYNLSVRDIKSLSEGKT